MNRGCYTTRYPKESEGQIGPGGPGRVRVGLSGRTKGPEPVHSDVVPPETRLSSRRFTESFPSGFGDPGVGVGTRFQGPGVVPSDARDQLTVTGRRLRSRRSVVDPIRIRDEVALAQTHCRLPAQEWSMGGTVWGGMGVETGEPFSPSYPLCGTSPLFDSSSSHRQSFYLRLSLQFPFSLSVLTSRTPLAF